jgi:predicted Zn-dependent peptidase
MHSHANLQTVTLKNGLRLVHQSPLAKGTHLTSIRVFCQVGSIHEHDPGMRGASHFVEHLCFKGTRKLPHAKDIFGEHDKMGAYLNAYTEKTHTCYVVDCHQDFAKHCLSILSDIMLNSTFPQKEYAKEYNVVLEENAKNRVEYGQISHEQLEFMAFQGTPYAWPVDDSCYHQDPMIPRSKLIEFYHGHYVPENIIISVVSPIPFSTITGYVRESHFGKTGRRSMPAVHRPLSNDYAKSCLRFTEQPGPLYIQPIEGIATTYLNVGFRTCNMYSPDYPVWTMVQLLLDGGASSRLFSLLREQHGLTYSSSAYATHNAMGGLFGISVVTDTRNLKSNRSLKKGVFDLLMGLVDNLAKQGFTKLEFKKMKEGFHNGVRNVEALGIFAVHNGCELMHYPDRAQPRSYFDWCRIYDEVTLKQINACMRETFTREKMFVSMVGGGRDFPTQSKVETWVRA